MRHKRADRRYWRPLGPWAGSASRALRTICAAGASTAGKIAQPRFALHALVACYVCFGTALVVLCASLVARLLGMAMLFHAGLFYALIYRPHAHTTRRPSVTDVRAFLRAYYSSPLIEDANRGSSGSSGSTAWSGPVPPEVIAMISEGEHGGCSKDVPAVVAEHVECLVDRLDETRLNLLRRNDGRHVAAWHRRVEACIDTLRA